MNIGGFLRRLSTSSDAEDDERTGSILDSMAAKKNGIMSDLSSTFHHIKRRASLEALGLTEQRSRPEEEAATASAAAPAPVATTSTTSDPAPPKPPLPPPPATAPTGHNERRRSSTKPRPPRPPSPPKDRRPSQSSTNDPPFRDRRNSLVDDPPYTEPYRRESISKDFGFGAEGKQDGGAQKKDIEPSIDQQSGLEDITQLECQKIVSALGDLMSFDNDGGDSSASEYGGDHGDAPFYAEEAPVERRASLASVESLSDETALSIRQFVSKFTEQTFEDNNEISQNDKAAFGKFCQHHTARSWFAKQLQKMRQTKKCVSETTFYSLVQHFSVVLFECNEAEDYVPAMNLMHMSFTFYTEVRTADQPPKIIYLYNFLKDQAIWVSLRFWNAAFFEAVQEQRANNPICWNEDGKKAVENDTRYQENIMFGQLSAFLCNMRALGLSKDVCIEFLRKQSTIAGLKPDQINMLRENIENWKD